MNELMNVDEGKEVFQSGLQLAEISFLYPPFWTIDLTLCVSLRVCYAFCREEKSEQLSECREELEHTKLVLAKLRSDSQEWFNEARKSAGYRDEVDALREKADRCDR